jgi:hypothetical protein
VTTDAAVTRELKRSRGDQQTGAITGPMRGHS